MRVSDFIFLFFILSVFDERLSIISTKALTVGLEKLISTREEEEKMNRSSKRVFKYLVKLPRGRKMKKR